MMVSKDESAYQAACCVCCVVSGCVRICAARVAKERVAHTRAIMDCTVKWSPV